MEFWILVLIVAVPILTVLGWLFWFLVFGFIAKKGLDAVASAGAVNTFGAGAGYADLDALFAQVDQALRAASAGSTGAGAHTAGTQHLSLQQQQQIQAMMMQAQNRMSQLDALHQQRYEGRMADINGMAVAAGIDPPTFY